MCTLLSSAIAAEPQMALRSIDSLSKVDVTRRPIVLLRGTVTLFLNSTVYVQDQTAAIEVHPIDTQPLALGDEVELSGIYTRSENSPVIQNATMHRLWSGSEPVPVALTPEQAAEGDFSSRLIEVEGRLVRKQTLPDEATFAFEGNSQLFAAHLDFSSPGSTAILSQFEPGAVVRLTGICTLPAERGESAPVSFTILLRSLDDLHIVSPAPWWNRRHLAYVAVALIGLLLMLHRIHVHNLNLRFRAVMDERSRLAREMHDTLAQGFSGVALQLETLAHELRGSRQTPLARQQLDIALKMVRHSREEAYSSIFILRSLARENLDFLKVLVDDARLKHGAQHVEMITATTGGPFLLSADTAHNLIRIGQEAVTNAIRHSGASRIELSIEYSDTALTLCISDNGKGFDVTNANSSEIGHFGLTGMRERAARINAIVRIESSLHHGTTIIAISPRDSATAETLRLPRILGKKQ
jgi:signal transduction histidine kinase